MNRWAADYDEVSRIIAEEALAMWRRRPRLFPVYIHAGRFILYVGRDMCRWLPASFEILWLTKGWEATAKKDAVYPCVWRVGASWAWLPRLLWRGWGSRVEPYVDSWAWTGRCVEVIGCRWDSCGSWTAGKRSGGFTVGRIWGRDW